MNLTLTTELHALISAEETGNIKEVFQKRLVENELIMQENPISHFCVYTLPFYPKTKEIFIGHHIKADKWIVPGGHIEQNETIKETAIREVEEELGQKLSNDAISNPFFFSVSHITSKLPRRCETHFDIWIYFSSETKDFVVDMSEFYETKWLSLTAAIALTTDPANKMALQKFSTAIAI